MTTMEAVSVATTVSATATNQKNQSADNHRRTIIADI